MRVNLAQVSEISLWRFAADASDLGLAPGKVPPRTLDTDIGNGMPLEAVRSDEESWHYEQPLGVVSLVIFND